MKNVLLIVIRLDVFDYYGLIVFYAEQRQIAIPKDYFDNLQMQEEVTIELVDGGLLIKPVLKLPDNFVENLLGSLVAKGLSGQELLEKFKEVSSNVGWTTFGTEKKDDII